MLRSLLFLFASLALIKSASGQATGRLSPPPANAKKQIEDAAAKLLKSQGSGGLEKAKEAAQGLIQKLPGSVTDAAQKAMQSPDAKAQAMEALKSAATNLAPAAQKMLNQPEATPLNPANPAVEAAPVPQGPKPLALQPLNAQPSKNAQPTAVIEAEKSDFDLNAGIFIYSGNVRARHPDFYIECEELEVHMIMDQKGKPPTADTLPAPVKPDAAITVAPAAKKDKAPPIKKAIARGPMVTIEKRDENGDVQIGKCRRLDYDGATGKIVLSENPQVQRGNILHLSTQPDTTMTFDQSGRLQTNGRPRTLILSDDKPAAPVGVPAASNPQAQ
jgi:lipopolysaccharide export system protein LptA